MKSLIIAFLLGLLITTSKAQTTEIAKFVISDARKNKDDVTKMYTDAGAFLRLYTLTGSSQIMFGNFWPKSQTVSYGMIYDLKHEHGDATASDFGYDSYEFKWSYQNSFDNKKGTASILLVIAYKPVGSAFACTVTDESLNYWEYHGFVSGSLQSLKN